MKIFTDLEQCVAYAKELYDDDKTGVGNYWVYKVKTLNAQKGLYYIEIEDAEGEVEYV